MRANKALATKDPKFSPETVISGQQAFQLYDTFGFPYELTLEMAEEEGLNVDEAGFKEAMEAQKKKARENASFTLRSSSNDLAVFDDLEKEN